MAEITVEGWRAGYRGLVSAAFLDELSVGEHTARARERLAPDAGWETWVAEDGGRLLGHVTFGPSRDDDAPPGTHEVYGLYVRPAAWRRGIGRALLAQALERLRARGAARATLWAFEGNRTGRAFYEAEGWARASGRRDASVGGRDLPVVRYARSVPGGRAGAAGPGAERTEEAK